MALKNNILQLKSASSKGVVLKDYVCSFKANFSFTHSALKTLEFEKKLIRSSFKKEFGTHLPTTAKLRVSGAFFDATPNNTSTTMSRKFNSKINNVETDLSVNEVSNVNDFSLTRRLKHSAGAVSIQAGQQEFVFARKTSLESNGVFSCCSGQLLSTDWLLEHLSDQLKSKRGARGVLNNAMRIVAALMGKLKSTSPVLGVRIIATGRLGKRKKAMAQQISRSLGQVPLSSLKHKVDYSQGFVSTSLGNVGLKVWICYA